MKIDRQTGEKLCDHTTSLNWHNMKVNNNVENPAKKNTKF